MLGLKRPQFKSKKDALVTFFSYLSAPGFIILIGIAGVSKSKSFDLLSYKQAMQSIYFIIIVSIISLPFWWYKAFWAISAIMNDDYSNEPDTVICLNCQVPMLFTKVKNLTCPKCNGALENLEGFYERHPKLTDKESKK